MASNAPTGIKLHKKSATLELVYGDKACNTFSAEFLRVHSPSAEVRGHGKGQVILQTGKRHVNIVNLEPVATTRLSSASVTATILASIPGPICRNWQASMMPSGMTT